MRPSAGFWWLTPLCCLLFWPSQDSLWTWSWDMLFHPLRLTWWRLPHICLCLPYSLLPLTLHQHIIMVFSCGSCMCFPPTIPRYWTQVLYFMLPKHHADASINLELKRCATNNNCVSGPPHYLGLTGDLGLRATCCGCGQSAPKGPLRSGGQGIEGAGTV